ncbi:MAG: FecR domain-containing protein [Lentimonas sp.]
MSAIALLSVWTSTLTALDDVNVGSAIITSSKGKPIIKSASGSSRAGLHSTIGLTQKTITTGAKEHLFLACSNGLGIGIDSETEIYFKAYTQSPFSAERALLNFEPSTSNLEFELKRGAISIASEGLSPRSQVWVITANGRIRVHSAKCRIEQNNTGTTVFIFQGNVTFNYPNKDNREFISAGDGIRVSSQSATLNEVAEELSVETVDTKTKIFADAAKFAATRVQFKAPLEGQLAIPILVTPKSYFEQDPVRPYEFSE